MADDTSKKLRTHIKLMALLVTAAASLPFLEQLTTDKLETFHFADEGIWRGGLAYMAPIELRGITSLVCVFVLGLLATAEGWLARWRRFLPILAVVAFVLGSAFHGMFRVRYNVSEAQLVAAATSIKAEHAKTGTGSLSDAEVQQRAVGATGLSVEDRTMADYRLGWFYAMSFALWTAGLMLISLRSFYSSQKKRLR